MVHFIKNRQERCHAHHATSRTHHATSRTHHQTLPLTSAAPLSAQLGGKVLGCSSATEWEERPGCSTERRCCFRCRSSGSLRSSSAVGGELGRAHRCSSPAGVAGCAQVRFVIDTPIEGIMLQSMNVTYQLAAVPSVPSAETVGSAVALAVVHRVGMLHPIMPAFDAVLMIRIGWTEYIMRLQQLGSYSQPFGTLGATRSLQKHLSISTAPRRAPRREPRLYRKWQRGPTSGVCLPPTQSSGFCVSSRQPPFESPQVARPFTRRALQGCWVVGFVLFARRRCS